MTKKFSRRSFLVMGGQCLVGAAALAGCAKATEPPAPAAPTAASAAAAAPTSAPAAKGPVTVEYFGWGDPSDVPAWEQLIKMYQERNPNVTVNLTAPADPAANHYTKLQTMFAGGTPPHVAGFQGWEWQMYADKDLLAPLDDYIARDSFNGPFSSTSEGFEASTRRNGKRYLTPMQLGTMVMFYAKKPLDEAGIKYPTDDWTIDEFLDMAQKVTNTSGEKKLYGFQATGLWYRDLYWFMSQGKREFDNVVDPKKALFTQPEIVEMAQKFAYDVYHKMKISPTPADQSGGANTMQTGNVVFKYDGGWFFPQLNSPKLRDEGKNVEFDVVMMPKGKDPARRNIGWAEGVVMPKTNAETQENAWDFISFMAGEDGDKVFSEITGRIPNDPKLIESFWVPMIKERFGVTNGKAFLESLKQSEIFVVSGVPRSKMWTEVIKPVGWDPMMNGSAEAAEVLPKVNEGVQKLLDDYWASKA